MSVGRLLLLQFRDLPESLLAATCMGLDQGRYLVFFLLLCRDHIWLEGNIFSVAKLIASQVQSPQMPITSFEKRWKRTPARPYSVHVNLWSKYSNGWLNWSSKGEELMQGDSLFTRMETISSSALCGGQPVCVTCHSRLKILSAIGDFLFSYYYQTRSTATL